MKKEEINLPNPIDWKEEKECFKKYYLYKNEKLKEKLIENNLRLILYCTRSISRYHNINEKDLVSYGYEGLKEAVERFNPIDNDNRFSTFAIPYILGHIKQALPNEKNMRHKFYHDFCKVRYELFNNFYTGTDEELNEILDTMIERKLISSNFKIAYYSLISDRIPLEEVRQNIDVTENNDDNLLLELEKNNNYQKLQEIINDILNNLRPRDREIIKLRFGFDGPCHTLVETGKILNVSREAIRQAEAKILQKLYITLKKDKEEILDYLDINEGEPNLSHKI